MRILRVVPTNPMMLWKYETMHFNERLKALDALIVELLREIKHWIQT